MQVFSRAQGARAWLDELIEVEEILVWPIDEPIIRLAADAFERFGKGRGHPAQLNFGDCMSYAVAKRLEAQLLFTGADFVHTDLLAAFPA